MPQASGYIPGPYEGVSQAPAQARLAGSCELMEDCLPALPHGVQKRPPFTMKKLLFKFGTADLIIVDSKALWADVPRGSSSLDLSLLLNKEAGVTKAYLFQTGSDYAPVEVTVTADAQTYLNTGSPDPNTDIHVCSVEDVTFIANRKVTVATGSAAAATRPFEALVWCRAHGFSRTTKVTVTSAAIGGGSYTASYTSAVGTGANDALTVGTDKLAKALYDGTDPSPGLGTPNPNPLNALTGSGFTVVLDGSVIYLSHATVDFTLTVTDDVGGGGVQPVKEEVQRFSDLPAQAYDGFVVKIAQSAIGGNSDYYVKFEATGSSNVGKWKEAIAPGANLGIDPKKMPVGLVFEGGAWTIKILPWAQRATGDVNLNPDPEFVGDTIEDVGWWRGRLLLLSNGQANLSASDNPYNFYTSTLAASLDSDPMVFLPPVDIKGFFRQAVIFDQRLLLMGLNGQAIVSSSGPLTPANARIDPLSKARFTDRLRVQQAHTKAYFGLDRKSGYMAVHEISIDRISGTIVPEDTTAAVPRFLPATLDRACTVEDEYMSLYGTSGSSRLYLHVYRHADQDRVQNAWSVWNLPTGYTLTGMYSKGSTVYAIISISSGATFACELELAPLTLDTLGTIQTYADLRITEAQATSISYDAVNARTTFMVPLAFSNGLKGAVRTSVGGGGFPEGYAPPVYSYGDQMVTFVGDLRGVPMWIGYSYLSQIEPTRFYKRGGDGNPELAGRLTVKRARLDLANFGYLKAQAFITGRNTLSFEFQGLSEREAILNPDVPPDVSTVSVMFPMGGKNTQTRLLLSNDALVGFALVGMEWEGDWRPKAARTT